MDSNDDTGDPVEYDPETEEYRVRFDGEEDSPVVAVVQAMAAVEGTDPTALDPLATEIDLNALEEIAGPSIGGSDVRVQFCVQEYRVTVDSGGLVALQPIDSGEESADTAT